jgi:hypothetical protein
MIAAGSCSINVLLFSPQLSGVMQGTEPTEPGSRFPQSRRESPEPSWTLLGRDSAAVQALRHLIAPRGCGAHWAADRDRVGDRREAPRVHAGRHGCFSMTEACS